MYTHIFKMNQPDKFPCQFAADVFPLRSYPDFGLTQLVLPWTSKCVSVIENNSRCSEIEITWFVRNTLMITHMLFHLLGITCFRISVGGPLDQCFSNYLMWRTGSFFFNVPGTGMRNQPVPYYCFSLFWKISAYRQTMVRVPVSGTRTTLWVALGPDAQKFLRSP